MVCILYHIFYTIPKRDIRSGLLKIVKVIRPVGLFSEIRTFKFPVNLRIRVSYTNKNKKLFFHTLPDLFCIPKNQSIGFLLFLPRSRATFHQNQSSFCSRQLLRHSLRDYLVEEELSSVHGLLIRLGSILSYYSKVQHRFQINMYYILTSYTAITTYVFVYP